MIYSIKQLAQLSGVSARALRYYDSIGLLTPQRVADSGYRQYTSREVDKLQRILFYKRLGLSLSEIKGMLENKDKTDIEKLQGHLVSLEKEKARLELLIKNVRNTILKEEGKIMMSDKEKFEGLKDELIQKNEELYGGEIRGKYSDQVVDASNQMLKNMTKEQYESANELAAKISGMLKSAVEKGIDPNDQTAKQIASSHKEWLCCYWPQYSPEAHIALSEMYVEDDRFTQYYDSEVKGCADFLHKAITAHAHNL